MSQGSESGLFNEDRGAQSIVRKKKYYHWEYSECLVSVDFIQNGHPSLTHAYVKGQSHCETIGILKPWLFVKSLLLSFCAKIEQ